MASDAHIHPYYLKDFLPDFKSEISAFKIKIAASAFSRDEFLWNKTNLDKTFGIRQCFGVHPQLALEIKKGAMPDIIRESLEFLESISGGVAADRNDATGNDAAWNGPALENGTLAAIGEAGFDLFDSAYRETEKTQEEIFNIELELALRYSLPLVLHIRKAMHKVFLFKKQLKKLPAVVFHSFSGSFDEAVSILRNGINAWFSFGSSILLNHKNAIRAVSLLPAERLLFETDAPYQPLRGKAFSSCADIFAILKKAAALRGLHDTGELESITDENFSAVFDKGR